MPPYELKTYDVVYLTGGRTSYLLERINNTGFRDTLLTYIRDNGFVIGVSAGSIIFGNNLPGNLALLDTNLDVHCESCSLTGIISFPLIENMKLSNTAALLIRNIPDEVEIIDVLFRRLKNGKHESDGRSVKPGRENWRKERIKLHCGA